MSGFVNYVMCLPIKNFYSDVKEYMELNDSIKRTRENMVLASKLLKGEAYSNYDIENKHICRMAMYILNENTMRFVHDKDLVCDSFSFNKACDNKSCFHYCYNRDFFEKKQKYYDLLKRKKAFWYNKVNDREK